MSTSTSTIEPRSIRAGTAGRIRDPLGVLPAPPEDLDELEQLLTGPPIATDWDRIPVTLNYRLGSKRRTRETLHVQVGDRALSAGRIRALHPQRSTRCPGPRSARTRTSPPKPALERTRRAPKPSLPCPIQRDAGTASRSATLSRRRRRRISVAPYRITATGGRFADYSVWVILRGQYAR